MTIKIKLCIFTGLLVFYYEIRTHDRGRDVTKREERMITHSIIVTCEP